MVGWLLWAVGLGLGARRVVVSSFRCYAGLLLTFVRVRCLPAEVFPEDPKPPEGAESFDYWPPLSFFLFWDAVKIGNLRLE